MIRPLLETESELAAPRSDAATLAASLPMSRRAVLAAGALVAAVIALPTLPARADFVYGDLKTLRLLEEIARVEADFFLKAAISPPADAFPERDASIVNLIAREDGEVARWFGAARDKYGVSAFEGPSTLNQASSRPIPNYHFPLTSFAKRDEMLERAIEIKGIAVGSYHSGVGSIKDPKLVEAFAAIAGVQGRHLAMLLELAGQSPFAPFEPTVSLDDAARKFAPYGFNMEVAG